MKPLDSCGTARLKILFWVGRGPGRRLKEVAESEN
jgi:hypothetical protein